VIGIVDFIRSRGPSPGSPRGKEPFSVKSGEPGRPVLRMTLLDERRFGRARVAAAKLVV
jgi:hypothetical protein